MIFGKILFFLYTISCFPIQFIFYLASFLNPRAKVFREIRIQAKAELKSLKISKENPIYWLHGASVGELDQAKTLARVIKQNQPKTKILITWVSDSVTEKNLKDSPADFHFPLPLDGPFSYQLILKTFSPSYLLIFAWDTWAWLIYSAKKNSCKVYLVCATLGTASNRKKGILIYFTRLIFSWLDGIYPTHTAYEKDFLELYPNKIHPTIQTLGDTRFDAVVERILNTKPNPNFQNWIDSLELNSLEFSILRKEPIVFASTYSICEKGILDWLAISQFQNKISIWIFPHKINSFRIEKLKSDIQNLGWDVALYSEKKQNSSITIFDELGILAYAYQYSKLVYVGGGFHHRIHNVIEPAYFGNPILTGTKIENSSEAQVLESIQGLFKFSTMQELTEKVESWLLENFNFQEIRMKNKKFVLANTGASQRIYEKIWKKSKI